MQEKNVEGLRAEARPQVEGRRAAILERFRTARPDVEGEPDDNALMEFLDDRYAELDGKYNELNGANVRLANLVSANPELGALLSLIASDKPMSVPRALSTVFGREVFEMDDDDLEEFEAGYQENLKRLAESRALQKKAAQNIKEYENRLRVFQTRNKLTNEEVEQLNDAIYEDAENFLNGIVPAEYIEYKWKGMNYDKDTQEAADTGYVEGRNAVVEAKMRKKTEVPPIPSLTSGSGSGRNEVRPQRKGSFYDAIKDGEG